MTQPSHNQPHISGYLFALGATAIWSGNFVIARGLSESIPPVSLAFFRWSVAVIAFLPFALKSLIAEWDIIKANIPYLSLIGLLSVTAFNTLIYIAGHTTTALNLSLISITFPIFIIILAWIFLHERLTLNKGFGIVLVMAGVILLITNGDLAKLINISFAIGDLWVLLAAIIFAVYSILLKQKPKQMSIWTVQLTSFILGLLFLSPFFVWEIASVPPFEFNIGIISAILYIGIFASLTAFIFWHKAVETVGATKASMVYYTMPLFSGFLAYLFLDEKITIIHLYSVILIVSGILMANYESKNAR